MFLTADSGTIPQISFLGQNNMPEDDITDETESGSFLLTHTPEMVGRDLQPIKDTAIREVDV